MKKQLNLDAQVICLPELFRSQYFCQKEDIENFKLAETVPGASTTAISEIAKKNNVSVVVPLFEKRSSGVYHNSLVVINNDGKILDTYRKMHIPDDPGFYEKYYFSPGDLGYKNFETSFGKIGTLICWDQWYPEAARLTSLQGAAVLFYPTAIGWHPYCGLVYVACAGATATGDLFIGALYMLAFGAGTVPMMLAISLSGKLVPVALRLKLLKAVPLAVFILGTLLILRGMSLGIPYVSPDLSGGGAACCHP